MTDDNQKGQSTSVLRLFEEGKKFTEDLLKENEKLRLVIANLKSDKRELENKYVKVDVPRMQERIVLIEEENRQLKEEISELKSQFNAIEEENWEFAERYVEVERQNSNLINMYVASYRLHSTLSYDDVIMVVKEIIINMIGSEQFAIYVYDESDDRLMLIASEGCERVEADQVLEMPEAMEAIRNGSPYMKSDDLINADDGKPAACIPLKVGEKVVGAIVIHKLLIQKDGFQSLDFELFEMLGGHAATAIYGSHLYTVSERKRSTLEGFIKLLKGESIKPEAAR